MAACDTDSLAVRATAENGRSTASPWPGASQVALGSVEALEALLDGRRPPVALQHPGAGDRGPLPRFHTVLAPEGVGLLSGLLVEQAPGLERVLAAAGWRAELTGEQGLGVDGDPVGRGCFIRHADLCSAFDWPSRVPAESSP